MYVVQFAVLYHQFQAVPHLHNHSNYLDGVLILSFFDPSHYGGEINGIFDPFIIVGHLHCINWFPEYAGCLLLQQFS